MKSLFASVSMIGLAASLALAATPSHAAEVGPGAEPINTSTALGEVVVTAQKRSENVQKVAAAISAIGRVQIEQMRVNANADLRKLAPSVNVTTYFNIPSINIRGLGNEASNPSGDASVATYVDGVYQARPTGTTSAFEDLDRIEVLRGPQGTLYGRNTTGGVVNLITRTPSDRFGANIYASYGSFNEAKVTGGIEGPLTSVWDTRARVSFYHDSHDGTMINTFNGEHANDLEADAVRLTLVTNPTSNLKITVRGDYNRDWSNGNNPQIIACEPYSNALLSTPCNPAGAYGIATNPAYDPVLAASINNQLGVATPSIHQGIYYIPGLDGIHQSFNDRGTFVSHSNYGGSITVDWSITPQISLKSISSYRFSNYNEGNDADGSSSNYISFLPAFEESSHAQTQELDLNGTMDNGATWSVGLFGFGESIGGSYRGVFPGLALQYTGAIQPDARYYEMGNFQTFSYSAYAQATAPITDKIKVTAGVRENYDLRSTHTNLVFEPFGSAPIANCTYNVNYANTTYKAGLEYQLAARNMLYATVSTGFKAGGVNIGLCGSQYDTFAPENLTAYEFGSKNIFFDGKLLVNMDVYYYDYKGYQADILTGSTVEVVNAANAVINGAEIEVQAKPFRNLTVSGNLGWSHNSFTDFVTPNPLYAACPIVGGPPECQNYLANQAIGPFGPGQQLKGKNLPHSPQWIASGQAEYVIPLHMLGDEDQIRLHYDVQFNSGWYGDVFNEKAVSQKEYVVHNASVAFTHKDYEVGAFVDNFTNTFYAESKYAFSTASAIEANWAPLRRWGVYAKAKF
jgi:iron complex outermembrane recepter protein